MSRGRAISCAHGMSIPFVASPSWRTRQPPPAAELLVGDIGGRPARRGAAVVPRLMPSSRRRPMQQLSCRPSMPPWGEATSPPSRRRPGLRSTSRCSARSSRSPPTAITDLFVNGEQESLGRPRRRCPARARLVRRRKAEVRALAVRLIARGGRHVDEATAVDGAYQVAASAFTMVLPPVSATGTLISVRSAAHRRVLARRARARRHARRVAAASRRGRGRAREHTRHGCGRPGKTTLLMTSHAR